MTTNAVLVKQGQQIRFLISGDFSPVDPGTDYTVGTPTDVVLTMSAIAAGAGRQSTKIDLGAVRAAQFSCSVAVDFTGETTTGNSGQTISLRWLPSASVTPGTGNIAGNSGIDGVAPAGATTTTTLAEFVKMSQYIGDLIVPEAAGVYVQMVGAFSPLERYGQMLVVNNTDDPFEADNVEMAVWMNPIIDDIQAAA